MKTVITYGTFDMFHIGHLNIIDRLTELGDRVIIGVSTDDFNITKGKKTFIPYSQRSAIVQSIKGVDLVFPEVSWDQKVADIKKYQADMFVIGADWEGKFDDLNEHCEVKYLPRTSGISTTEIKQSLKNFTSVPKAEIIQAIEILELLKQDFG